MNLTQDVKGAIVQKYGSDPKDTGKCEVQIALFTTRIKELTEHFKIHKKDNNSKYGLLKMVGRRRRLLQYLQRIDPDRYRAVVRDLGLRR